MSEFHKAQSTNGGVRDGRTEDLASAFIELAKRTLSPVR